MNGVTGAAGARTRRVDLTSGSVIAWIPPWVSYKMESLQSVKGLISDDGDSIISVLILCSLIRFGIINLWTFS